MYLHIVIHDKNKPGPSFPEITDKNFKGELVFDGVAIMQGGMASGKDTVGLRLKDKDGNFYIAQQSADMMHAFFAAMRCAGKMGRRKGKRELRLKQNRYSNEYKKLHHRSAGKPFH